MRLGLGVLSVKYQDQKIKVIARLTVTTVVMTLLLAVSLIYSDLTRNLVQYLPLSSSRNEGEYGVWLGVLAITVPIFWGVNIGLILTSPEQEVRFVKWSKRWRKTPLEFEEIEFDLLDPDYHKTARRYFLDQYKR